jgi:hypothetical protein
LGFALGRIRRQMTIDQRQERAVRRRVTAADRRRMNVGPRVMMVFALTIVGLKTTAHHVAMVRHVVVHRIGWLVRHATALETAINRLLLRHGQKWG